MLAQQLGIAMRSAAMPSTCPGPKALGEGSAGRRARHRGRDKGHGAQSHPRPPPPKGSTRPACMALPSLSAAPL